MKPKIHTQVKSFGDLEIKFEGEQWDDDDKILDTKVTIDGNLLCWISWEEKDNFMKELNKTTDLYRI